MLTRCALPWPPPRLLLLSWVLLFAPRAAVQQVAQPWHWSRIEVTDGIGPAARQGHSAVEVGQEIYIFGGCSVQDLRCYDDLWVFDTERLRWQRKAAVGRERPDARAGHSSTLVGGDIFVYGGASSQQSFGDVFKFDLVHERWTRLAELVANAAVGPGRRANHAAALDAQGSIYVFGGYSQAEGSCLSDLWLLTLAEADERRGGRVTWIKPSVTGVVPEPRESHTLTIVDRKLILFGGYASSGRALNDLHLFDLDALGWSSPALLSGSPPPREGHSAVRHGHELIVAGGCNVVDEHPACQSDVWSLDMKRLRWVVRSTDSITWAPRQGHSATFVRGRMFTFGGCLLGAECYEDIAALDTFTPCPSACGGHGQCMRSCDGEGVCSEDLFCRCTEPGFSGHDCLQPAGCLLDCGVHGACGQDGRCQCKSGWAGDECSTELICPGSPTMCSGHGVCQGNNTCHCITGFTGPDCVYSIPRSALELMQPATVSKVVAAEAVPPPEAGIASMRLRASHSRGLPDLAASGKGSPAMEQLAGDGSLLNQPDFGMGAEGTPAPPVGPTTSLNCEDMCNYRGFCNKGVCWCQPHYFGETCGIFKDENAPRLDLVQAAVVVAVVIMFSMCFTFIRASKLGDLALL